MSSSSKTKTGPNTNTNGLSVRTNSNSCDNTTAIVDVFSQNTDTNSNVSNQSRSLAKPFKAMTLSDVNKDGVDSNSIEAATTPGEPINADDNTTNNLESNPTAVCEGQSSQKDTIELSEADNDVEKAFDSEATTVDDDSTPTEQNQQ